MQHLLEESNRQGSTTANRAMETRHRQTRYRQRVEAGSENQSPVKTVQGQGRQKRVSNNNQSTGQKYRKQTKEKNAQKCY